MSSLIHYLWQLTKYQEIYRFQKTANIYAPEIPYLHLTLPFQERDEKNIYILLENPNHRTTMTSNKKGKPKGISTNDNS